MDETLRAVEHELTALLRRGRALSWEIAREVHPNLEPNAYGLLLWLRRSGRSASPTWPRSWVSARAR
ncbi:hypothetical protein V2I01_22610 [Micromonospora sp. BRA006-A]|nr:hypothetical protein [Micromonospora sp. BRA006-A]